MSTKGSGINKPPTNFFRVKSIKTGTFWLKKRHLVMIMGQEDLF
ncbi:hypothetical protein yfred0001_41140 [Yersinia frederiksenii ATCC 33641]|nr:hypothetical protein yfred0001_41140 [Yersinia frederiksenii ATCC 33641]